MPDRVIFLDMDGVLNSHPYILRMEIAHPNEMDFIEPICVERLNRIVEATGAGVVVTSAWRGQYDFQKRLDEHGFKGRFLGETPEISRANRVRGDEILAWLVDHGPLDGYVILDDDCDMGRLLPRLVKTSLWTGMLDEHVQPAIDMILKPMGLKDFPEGHFSGWGPYEIVHLLCMRAVSDPVEIEHICSEVLDAYPAEVAKYRQGKKGLIGMFVKAVMDRTRNGAQAEVTTETLRRLLDVPV